MSGFVYVPMMDGDEEAAIGAFKLWMCIGKETELGEERAGDLVVSVLEHLKICEPFIAAAKVSVDRPSVLVVYLSPMISNLKAATEIDSLLAIVQAMRTYHSCSPIKMGWADKCGSETLCIF
jgi:hypothetical protein